MAHQGSDSRRVYRFAGLLLSSLFIGAQVAVGKNCSVEPTSIPFTDVTVLFAPDRSASHRSMAWVAGSQNVPLGIQVGTTLNSSFIPEAQVCTDTIDRGCVFWRGGIFETNSSRTWRSDTHTSAYNASRSNQGWDYLNYETYKGTDPISAFPRGWDNFQIVTSNDGRMNLDNYPMVVIDNGTFPFGQGVVGLASDSSFLAVMVEKNLIPSRSWALDYGLSAANNTTVGELVIGGYNRQKASADDFEMFPVFPDKNTPCPLQVRVNKISWGTADLMTNQEPFLACLEPAYWTTVMPRAVRQNFNRTMLTGSNVSFVSSDWEYIKYNNSDPTQLPPGDIYIELNGGFNVTIPRSEWIFPAKTVNHNFGQWDLVPDMIQTTIGNAGFPDSVDPKIPFLGAPFLSQVYLRVDYETQVFGIAPIKRNNVGAPSLIRLGCDGYVDPNDDSSSTTSPTTTPSPSSGSGSKTGAIAGGVVGGLAGLVISGVAALCFIRRRKRAAAAIPADRATDGAVAYDQNKDQIAPNMSQYGSHGYDEPPAFSPTGTPAPYSPVGSPVYTAPGGVPRRPLPGQQPYGFYDNQGGYTSAPAAELGGGDFVAASELSGRPRSTGYEGAFAEGNMDDPSTHAQTGPGKR